MITCILPGAWLLHFQLLELTFFFGWSPKAMMQHYQFLYPRHTEEAFRLRRLKHWQYAVKTCSVLQGFGQLFLEGEGGQMGIQAVAEDAVKQEK